MLVAKDPHVNEKVPAADINSGCLEVTCVQPELNCFEDVFFHIRKFKLAFCCFLE